MVPCFRLCCPDFSEVQHFTFIGHLVNFSLSCLFFFFAHFLGCLFFFLIFRSIYLPLLFILFHCVYCKYNLQICYFPLNCVYGIFWQKFLQNVLFSSSVVIFFLIPNVVHVLCVWLSPLIRFAKGLQPPFSFLKVSMILWFVFCFCHSLIFFFLFFCIERLPFYLFLLIHLF